MSFSNLSLSVSAEYWAEPVVGDMWIHMHTRVRIVHINAMSQVGKKKAQQIDKDCKMEP